MILSSVRIPLMSRYDIRMVDHSLFDDGNCVVIYRRHATPATPFTSTFTPSSSPAGSMTGRPIIEDPLYLRMTSVAACQSWLVMLQCFAKPEILEAAQPPPQKPLLFQRRSHSFLGHNASDTGSVRSSVNGDHLITRQEHIGGSPQPSSNTNSPASAETRCRVFRSLALSINEGRGIGERGVETVRGAPKSSLDSNRQGATSPVGSSADYENSPSKLSAAMGLPRLGARAYSSEARNEHEVTSFCEIVMEGEVIARTSERKSTTSPFFNESFHFTSVNRHD